MASGKVSAVGIWLVLFVMSTVLLGVALYMYHDESVKLKTDVVDARNKEKVATDGLRNATENIEALKKKMGYNHQDIGLDDPQNANTVLGAAKFDIEKYGFGGEVQDGTFAQTLAKMRQHIDFLETQRQKLNQDLEQEKADKVSELAKLDGTIKTNQQARTAAELEREKLQKNKDEEVSAKVKELTVVTQKYRDAVAELEEFKRTTKEKIDSLNQEITSLENINDILRDKVFEIEKVTFDQPDGEILYVDRVNQTVWIDLGSLDSLPENLTFSVYRKFNDGIGQSSSVNDIKGSIEVTEILGGHRAKAKIVRDSTELAEPIAKGDPIFTPLWTPGLKYRFSLVGVIDMDYDGIDDREQLVDLIEEAGALVDNQIDENGVRTGEGVTVNTKFVVVGEILDPAEVEPKDRARAQKMSEEYNKIVKEARRHGVREVSLTDFREYMGFKIDRRIYRPGDRRPITLKSGNPIIRSDPAYSERRRYERNPSNRTRVPGTPKSSKAFPGKGY